MEKVIGTVVAVDDANVWLQEGDREVNVLWPAPNADVRVGHKLLVIAESTGGRYHFLTARNETTRAVIGPLEELPNVNVFLAGVLGIMSAGGVLGTMLCFFPLLNLIGGSVFAFGAFFKMFTDRTTIRPTLIGLVSFALSVAAGFGLRAYSDDNIIGWLLIGFAPTIGCVIYAGLLFRSEITAKNKKAREANRILAA